jgi:hypothetical protein
VLAALKEWLLKVESGPRESRIKTLTAFVLLEGLLRASEKLLEPLPARRRQSPGPSRASA